MKSSKLSTMPYAQAHVEFWPDGSIVLVSYETIVAVIDNNKWLSIRGLYSATTRKHIGAFVKEYANTTYQTAKFLFNNNMKMNIETGEVEG